jgi:hypothetical protein
MGRVTKLAFRALAFVFLLGGRLGKFRLRSGKAPWARIVIIGASVSHGFTETEAFGGPKQSVRLGSLP